MATKKNDIFVDTFLAVFIWLVLTLHNINVGYERISEDFHFVYFSSFISLHVLQLFATASVRLSCFCNTADFKYNTPPSQADLALDSYSERKITLTVTINTRHMAVPILIQKHLNRPRQTPIETAYAASFSTQTCSPRSRITKPWRHCYLFAVSPPASLLSPYQLPDQSFSKHTKHTGQPIRI